MTTEGISKGRQLYVFDLSELRPWWRRRQIEPEILRLLEKLAILKLKQYVWNIETSAGEVPETWRNWQQGLLQRAEDVLQNVGMADLQVLVELVKQEPVAAGVAVAA